MSNDFEDDQPAEQPMFTAKELKDIKDKAKSEVMAAKKESVRKRLMDEEKNRLMLEDGLTTGNSHMDEVMTITIDLASYANKILVNGKAYWHAQTYTVARHVAESLRETMFRTWQHQNEIDGKGMRDFYAQKHVQDLYKVGAPSRATFSARDVT